MEKKIKQKLTNKYIVDLRKVHSALQIEILKYLLFALFLIYIKN